MKTTQASAEVIYQYFERKFGEVDHVDLQSEDCTATIKFHQSEIARRASEQKQHSIDGSIVYVQSAEPVEEEEECSLMSLNDDCLIELLKYLNCNDQSSLALTCTRLLGLARTQFGSKRKVKVLSLTVGTLQDARDGLRAFGSLAHTVRLIHTKRFPIESPTNNKILRLLSKYSCRTWTTLELHQFVFYHLDSSMFEELYPLFYNMKKLYLNECFIGRQLLMVLGGESNLELSRTYITHDIPHQQKINVRSVRIVGHETKSRLDELRLLIAVYSAIDFEYFELEMHNKTLTKAHYEKFVLMDNMRSLKFYGNVHFPNLISGMEMSSQISELVMGYVHAFTVTDMLYIIRRNWNLKRLVVIYDDESENAEDHVPRNWNPPASRVLNVIIVGTETQIRPFDIVLPAKTTFKITCLLTETVISALKVNGCKNIKMSDEQVNVLRDCGLLSS